MQTILGANGVIGTGLARNLTTYTDQIRLVSRNPHKVNETDQLVSADLTNYESVVNAVNGSDIVYLTPGLKYDIRVWTVQWPLIMKNVLEACKKFGAKLVFFDNCYLYGKVSGWMTEDTPANPCSKKGEVRAKISDRLLSETRSGNLQALIARSADFYGPHTPLSFVNVMVFDKLKAGKKPQWMGNDLVKHSFTYTPDASKATAILGNTPEAYNQVWHVPTHPDALTGKEFITLASQAFDKQGIHYTLLKKWMVGMIAPFNRIIKESLEMIYQSEYEYLFDSSKFDKFFNYSPATYPEGIIQTARSMK